MLLAQRSSPTRLRLALLALLLVPLGAGASAQSSAWSVRGNGSWVQGNRIVRQTGATTADPKKYVVAALESSGTQTIRARVRVDSFPHLESRAGVSLRTGTDGRGYNFVLARGGKVAFLADGLAWGTSCTFNWNYGRWYWMQLSASGSSLIGKVWSDTQTEADATICSQSGWSHFTAGAPGLNGGAFGETASFDDVTIGSFTDDFNAGGPPAPAAPPAGFATSGQFVAAVNAQAAAASFDVGRFIDILTATGQRLICGDNPGACANYTPGTFAVIPSPFYSGGTWMRDSAWTIAGLNDRNLMATLTATFAAAGDQATGRLPTLIINGGGPWYGAGGQGNPLPDDDSNLMFAIAARLGWRTVSDLTYLDAVYQWIRSRAQANGTYAMTSHGWLDSFYPLGTGGPASVTVPSNIQGLYAVALRSLKDLGVAVPQSEIDAANAQYAALTLNGRLRAYADSDIVSVPSLMGEALSLFIWNQPILSDAVVEHTIASFAEVYDASGSFVGYKTLSAADGAFLPAGFFPVDNGGAGSRGGDYQNGGSWMLYEMLALYAAARHDIPGKRDIYIDRFVKRMASELRAGFGGAPVSRSHEFLCTAPAAPDAPCSPTGSAVPERADYGWNAFVARLLLDEHPVEAGGCTNCPAPTVTPSSLRFAATKLPNSADLAATTPPQKITIVLPSGATAWTATSPQTWLQVSPSSGTGNGQVTVSIVNPDNAIGASSFLESTITITPAGQTFSRATVAVALTVTQPGSSQVPFGQVETPSQNASGLVGAIGVTGWAMDDVGVAGVKIYRNCLPFENQASCQTVGGHSVVFVGDAAFLSGARPDVEAAFPTHPQAYRAGWGYLMLTSMLPHVTGQRSHGGQGPLTLYAFATDVEGNVRLLGRSQADQTATSITMANDTIAKPFGAIDTPGQGETVSGIVHNFGWALTPDTDTVAGNGDIFIPTNGASMTVFIDGQPVANVAYNQCRGTVGNPVPSGLYCNDDVSNIFGAATPQAPLTQRTDNPTKFRNLDAGRAAIGVYSLDTRALTNGMHTIAWSVTDSAGRNEGIGSRFFNVLNSSSDTVAAAQELQQRTPVVHGRAAQLDGVATARDTVQYRTGFGLEAAFTDVPPGHDGVHRVASKELDRLEIRVPFADRAYLEVNGELRDLPAGSSLRDGVFAWIPPAGFVGEYRLVFTGAGRRAVVLVEIASR